MHSIHQLVQLNFRFLTYQGISLHILSNEEWPLLCRARLAALQDSPESFLSRYETEKNYPENQWRAQSETRFLDCAKRQER